MEKIVVPFQSVPGKTVGLALITPDIAKFLLSLNIKNNRRISNARVESYAQDMRDDKFAETTMITIDENKFTVVTLVILFAQRCLCDRISPYRSSTLEYQQRDALP